MNRQTFQGRSEDADRQWHVIDATDQVLGRLSVKIAVLLMGKHKPTYTPHADMGDFVVVINADKIRLTGRKGEQKMFKRYSGYPSGLKQISYGHMLEHRPEKLLETSVRRMLPKNRLAAKMIKKMKIYQGADHPHQAQQPQPLSV